MDNITKADFTISGVQWMDTDDGYAYSFDLKLRGKKIAFVRQDGHGGPTNISYTNQATVDAVKAYCVAQPEIVTEFRDPHDKSKMFTYAMTDEHLMDELFGDWDEARQRKNIISGMKRAAKTKTLFRLKGESADTYHYLKATGERAMKWLRDKYADQLAAVFNPETGSWVEA